ncbi:MAG: phosphocarrier protein HPr [Spirochaetes bacterium]|nr:MAG: phosphocarrier protein HPr [Spirochaetota bacterium]
MVEKDVIIKNKTGLHARPAAILVQTANKFESDIFLEKDGDRVNAKSIMGVMMLAAAEGSKIKIIAEGNDEKEAVETIFNLLESNIDEANIGEEEKV